jgi:hypothetical protein
MKPPFKVATRRCAEERDTKGDLEKLQFFEVNLNENAIPERELRGNLKNQPGF